MTTFKKSTITWKKGEFDIEWFEVSQCKIVKHTHKGYVSKDQAIFAIHTTQDKDFTITHLSTGMRVATCFHLAVAKQVVSDFLTLDDTWEVDSNRELVNDNIANRVNTIHRANNNYRSEVGKNVENYCTYRDRC
jgi:hypothetical protein